MDENVPPELMHDRGRSPDNVGISYAEHVGLISLCVEAFQATGLGEEALVLLRPV